MSEIITIKLHGFLGKKYGEEVKMAGANIGQIMQGLKSRFGPQFKEDIRTNDWHLVPGDIDTAAEALVHAELGLALKEKILHFVPVIEASKKFFQIIIGVILVLVGTFVPGAQALIPIGYSMIVGGIVNLIFAPKMPNAGQYQNEDQASYVFNGAVNITSQGGVKPIIAGRVRRAGAVVISSDFSTDNIVDTITAPQNQSTDAPATTDIYIDLP